VDNQLRIDILYAIDKFVEIIKFSVQIQNPSYVQSNGFNIFMLRYGSYELLGYAATSST